LTAPVWAAAAYGAKTMLSRLGLSAFLTALFCVLNGWLSLGYALLAVVLLIAMGALVAAVRMALLLSKAMGEGQEGSLRLEVEVGRNGFVRFVRV